MTLAIWILSAAVFWLLVWVWMLKITLGVYKHVTKEAAIKEAAMQASLDKGAKNYTLLKETILKKLDEIEEALELP